MCQPQKYKIRASSEFHWELLVLSSAHISVMCWFRWLLEFCTASVFNSATGSLHGAEAPPPLLPCRCKIWSGCITDRHSASNPSAWPQCLVNLAFEFTFPLSPIIGRYHLLASCNTSLFFLSPPLLAHHSTSLQHPNTVLHLPLHTELCPRSPYITMTMSYFVIRTLHEVNRWFLCKTN